MEPPMAAIPMSSFSGVRHFLVFALCLSAPYIMKAMMLIIAR